MSDIHSNPDTHGRAFGDVVVTVDRAAGDCVVRIPHKRKGAVTPSTRTIRFNNLDEIRGAYAQQSRLSAVDPIAADYARALKHAGMAIKEGPIA